MNIRNRILFTLMIVGLLFTFTKAQSYKIVGTGQDKFYDNHVEISAPQSGEAFYGQDAQHSVNQASYTDNGDGTITDNVTGLMWSKSPDMNGDGNINVEDKLSFNEASASADTFSLAGYTDWRLPTIKEQYSLIMFYGLDPSGYNGTNTDNLIPFINTDYFEFGYGDVDSGERIIDAQFATSTLYVSTTMNGDETMFGVNFADGRIKGYPTGPMPGQSEEKGYYVMYVRGNPNYGINDFVNNSDGTITDNSTGLMWAQNDNGEGLNWEASLSYVQQKNTDNYLGYKDWRLPNVKELQSIVDYTRSPATTNSAAINALFNCSTITDEGSDANYPFYWTGTTHANMVNGGNAAYVCFGEGLGWMEMPPMSGNYTLMDVHGAGAQRSDPKEGNPEDYPYGHGPQGDVIRIYNYVRLVRDADAATSVGETANSSLPTQLLLSQNYPNPFNPVTKIKYAIPTSPFNPSPYQGEGNRERFVTLKVYDILGREVATLVNEEKPAGSYEIEFDGNHLSSGVYFYQLKAGNFISTKKMTLLQ